MRPFILARAPDLKTDSRRELTPAEFDLVFGAEDGSQVGEDGPSIGFIYCIDKGGERVLDPVIQDT